MPAQNETTKTTKNKGKKRRKRRRRAHQPMWTTPMNASASANEQLRWKDCLTAWLICWVSGTRRESLLVCHIFFFLLFFRFSITKQQREKKTQQSYEIGWAFLFWRSFVLCIVKCDSFPKITLLSAHILKSNAEQWLRTGGDAELVRLFVCFVFFFILF